MDPLSSTRTDIDHIDRELIRLLGARMEVVRKVGEFKQLHGDLPLRDPGRERELFKSWAREGEAKGLSSYFLGRILREVLNYSRRDQERFLEERRHKLGELRVGYQGAPASYSELSIHKLFAARPQGAVSPVGFHSFSATIDALVGGEIDYALVPIENTIAGSINEVYNLLGTRKVHVVDEEYWSVEHCLAGLTGADMRALRAVRSHPVALQQCGRFLSSLVGTTAESWYDTAAAAESVRDEGDAGVAAICSVEAAHRAGLEVLREGVADSKDNTTRFLLIAREAETVDPRLPSKTSMALTVNHSRGALAECLQAFSRAGINLTKLESRPQTDSPFEYLFYVDVEGSTQDERVAGALSEVRKHTNHLRVLGSYPSRAGVGEEPVALVDPALEELPVPLPFDGPPPSELDSRIPPKPKMPAIPKELKLAALSENGPRTEIKIGEAIIGPSTFTLISGPCAVESRRQILDAAEMVKARGAKILRGGAFKPRSSPYAFQGLGLEGLELLAEAGHTFELPVVTEVLRPEDVGPVADKADMMQVGARNMQNFELLKELGQVHRPVLLKRGMSATIRELLQAAEYIMAGGNQQVVLCERGIRTFETAVRNTLDLSAVPVLKERTHLPVIVDPSHAAGVRHLVVPLALAAAAVGADGLIVEAHPRPEEALCDKDQALYAADLDELRARLEPILRGRGLNSI